MFGINQNIILLNNSKDVKFFVKNVIDIFPEAS